MGQKTNPIGFRLGIIKSWESRWFSEKDYSKLLQEDITIRKFLIKNSRLQVFQRLLLSVLQN